jgi:hypothetical protein
MLTDQLGDAGHLGAAGLRIQEVTTAPEGITRVIVRREDT